MNRTDTLAIRTLLTMGRQRLGLEESQGLAVFNLAAAGAAMGHALHGALVRHRLTTLQFDVLVLLFALEPRPVTPSELSHCAGASRSSVSGAVGELLSRGHLGAVRAGEDRRQLEISLTESGRDLTEAAVTDYLQVLAGLAAKVSDLPAPSPPLVDPRPSPETFTFVPPLP